MLILQDMVQAVITELDGQVGQVKYLKGINDYVTSNIEITGNYVGLMANGITPDPLSGMVNATIIFPPAFNVGALTMAILPTITAPNPNLWLSTVFNEFAGTTISLIGPHVGIGPMIVTPQPLPSSDIDALKDVRIHTEAWSIYLSKVIDGLKASVIAPISTVTASGAGITTITSIT